MCGKVAILLDCDYADNCPGIKTATHTHSCYEWSMHTWNPNYGQLYHHQVTTGRLHDSQRDWGCKMFKGYLDLFFDAPVRIILSERFFTCIRTANHGGHPGLKWVDTERDTGVIYNGDDGLVEYSLQGINQKKILGFRVQGLST